MQSKIYRNLHFRYSKFANSNFGKSLRSVSINLFQEIIYIPGFLHRILNEEITTSRREGGGVGFKQWKFVAKSGRVGFKEYICWYNNYLHLARKFERNENVL